MWDSTVLGGSDVYGVGQDHLRGTCRWRRGNRAKTEPKALKCSESGRERGPAKEPETKCLVSK